MSMTVASNEPDYEQRRDGWTRRSFLARSGTAAGVLASAGAVAAGCSSGSGSTGDEEATEELDPSDWDSIRAQFAVPLDRRMFDAWVLGINPRQVTDTITQFRDELDQEPWRSQDDSGAREASTRQGLAELIGGEPDEVALTNGTAQGLGLVYGGIRLGRGHEILTTVHDDYVTQEAVRLAAQRTGATARQVRLYDNVNDAAPSRIVDRLLDRVDDGTRLVALTWVLPDTGLKLPIADIAAALADVNEARDEDDHVLLCVDGSYALGVEEVDVSRLGCDFLAAGLNHWMFGPRGTGICWGRPDAWERVDPILPSFAPLATEAWIAGEDPPEPLSGLLATPGGNHDLERRWAMTSAVAFRNTIGPEEIATWTLDQAAELKEGLSEVTGITLVTPTDEELSSALVCFRPERQDPHELLALLRGRFVMTSLAPFDPRVVRLGPSLVTSPEDVEAAVAAVGDLA